MSTLLPEGVTSLADAPFTLHHAIILGLRWLDFEKLPLDERPKRRIWMDGDKLSKWWEHVESMRKDKLEGKTPVDPDDVEVNELTLVTRD